jgi:2-dehydro-3-deoxyphosphogalactonate aldolase
MEMNSWLTQCPLVAILRGLPPPDADAIGKALIDAGLRIIEVPLNSPDPFRSIEMLARKYGDTALIGAGTVMTEADIDNVAKAGGRLIVTPHADPALVRAAKAAGLFAVPGFFTPAEAIALLNAGADALKLFPAEAGSPAMLKAIRAILPAGTQILPVGGVDATNIPAWHIAGAAGYGIGSAIYKPGDDAATVTRKAAALIASLPL